MPSNVICAYKYSEWKYDGPMAEQPWLDEDEMAAWRTFLRSAARLFDRLDADLRRSMGLSLADYEILVHLADTPDGALRMTALAGQVLVSRSGLTRRVDRLTDLGLVERRDCPSDRRGVFAVLTTEGRSLLEDAAPVHVAGVRRGFLEPVGPSRRAVLTEALSDVIQRAEAGDE